MDVDLHADALGHWLAVPPGCSVLTFTALTNRPGKMI